MFNSGGSAPDEVELESSRWLLANTLFTNDLVPALVMEQWQLQQWRPVWMSQLLCLVGDEWREQSVYGPVWPDPAAAAAVTAVLSGSLQACAQ